jgi:hypothetical protein
LHIHQHSQGRPYCNKDPLAALVLIYAIVKHYPYPAGLSKVVCFRELQAVLLPFDLPVLHIHIHIKIRLNSC